MIKLGVYDVIKNKLGDCTNNGLTSKVTRATLFHNCSCSEAIKFCLENGLNPAEQFILVKRTLWGKDHSYAEPLIDVRKKTHLQMYGGNVMKFSNIGEPYMFDYQSSNDEPLEIQIHDRFETQEEYNELSI